MGLEPGPSFRLQPFCLPGSVVGERSMRVALIQHNGTKGQWPNGTTWKKADGLCRRASPLA